MQTKAIWIVAAVLGAGLPALGWTFGGPGDPRAMASVRAEVFAAADSDASGGLSPEEFRNFRDLMEEKRIELHFAVLDANGDGQVSSAELSHAPLGCRGGRGPRW